MSWDGCRHATVEGVYWELKQDSDEPSTGRFDMNGIAEQAQLRKHDRYGHLLDPGAGIGWRGNLGQYNVAPLVDNQYKEATYGIVSPG